MTLLLFVNAITEPEPEPEIVPEINPEVETEPESVPEINPEVETEQVVGNNIVTMSELTIVNNIGNFIVATLSTHIASYTPDFGLDRAVISNTVYEYLKSIEELSEFQVVCGDNNNWPTIYRIKSICCRVFTRFTGSNRVFLIDGAGDIEKITFDFIEVTDHIL